MNNYPFPNTPGLELVGEAMVECKFDRLRGEMESGGAYLLTISVRPSVFGSIGAYPQTRAVIDDFGNLRAVREWR